MTALFQSTGESSEQDETPDIDDVLDGEDIDLVAGALGRRAMRLVASGSGGCMSLGLISRNLGTTKRCQRSSSMSIGTSMTSPRPSCRRIS